MTLADKKVNQFTEAVVNSAKNKPAHNGNDKNNNRQVDYLTAAEPGYLSELPGDLSQELEAGLYPFGHGF